MKPRGSMAFTFSTAAAGRQEQMALDAMYAGDEARGRQAFFWLCIAYALTTPASSGFHRYWRGAAMGWLTWRELR